MRRLIVFVSVVAAAVGLLLGASAASPADSARSNWVVTDLGTLGGDFSVARAVNAHGQIVGTSRTASRERHVFLWQAGRMVDIGRYGREDEAGVQVFPFLHPTVLLNERGQVAWDEQGRGWVLWQNGASRRLGFAVSAMNDRGQIVGASSEVPGATKTNPHGVLWENGRLRDLGVPGGDRSSRAVAINNAGVVAGVSARRSDRERAFLWRDGKIVSLAKPRSFVTCEAFAVNSAGQVLGYCETSMSKNYRLHAVLWDGAGVRDVGAREGSWVRPVALNDRGEVLLGLGGNKRPFVWAAGKSHDLRTLGGRMTELVAIDDQGRVVGWSGRANGARHAFLWRDGKMTDLGTLGGRDSYPTAINQGQVVGAAELRDQAAHAALWTLRP